MDSLTKNRQPVETLLAMVERAYGSDLVPDRATDWEQTSVPVPQVEFEDHSHEVCDADYFFMSFVDADNLAAVERTPSPLDRDGYQRALGAVTREPDGIRGTAYGALVDPRDATWRSAFLRMLVEVLDDGERRGARLGLEPQVLRDAVTAHAHVLDQVREPRFVEWDLWAGNCMVHPGRIVAILDHERAFWGDPLMEFGFAGCESEASGDATAFLPGYGRGPLTASERVRRRLYNVHLLAIQIVEMSFRNQYDEARHDWLTAHLRTTLGALNESERQT